MSFRFVNTKYNPDLTAPVTPDPEGQRRSLARSSVPYQRDELIHLLYYRHRRTPASIAEELGCSEAIVTAALWEHQA